MDGKPTLGDNALDKAALGEAVLGAAAIGEVANAGGNVL